MQGIEELLKRNYSVIPMKAEAKKPAVYWKYYQTKRATIREIERWHKQFGETNYAIVCGLISDLGVIDVDDLKMIPKLLEKIPNLFDTCVIKTPRPGLQFYFSLGGRHIKSIDKLFGLAGVELRCEGRYVMSPGSVIGGVKYVFERPLSCILPIPKIIIDGYIKVEVSTGVLTGGITGVIKVKVRAKCVEQILNYDIPKDTIRELAYFIAYSKLREAGNTVKYSKYIIKLANRNLSEPLAEEEIENFDHKKTYYYGCPLINESLDFINCSFCQVRGGLKVQSLAMRSFHKLKGLTNTQRAILFILDTYFKGLVGEELPTIYEIQKYSDTSIGYYTIKNALGALKGKGII
ncbi:hypothetical protein ES705_36023 [subsurface metagenome]